MCPGGLAGTVKLIRLLGNCNKDVLFVVAFANIPDLRARVWRGCDHQCKVSVVAWDTSHDRAVLSGPAGIDYLWC